MADWRKLLWVWRRLGRMSSAEIAHRAVEQVKRMLGRPNRRPWSAFGDFPGEVRGLPGLRAEAAGAALRARLAIEAQAAVDGRFAFFGTPWPDIRRQGHPWWAGDLWLIDPVSGQSWPGAARYAFDVSYRGREGRGDVKFVWEFNRLQVLPPLALQARLTGDAEAAAPVFALLRGWMRANPPSRGVNWTSGVEAASRVVSLLAALAFVSPATPGDEADVRAFLDAHLRWIARYPSRFSSANNHRVGELAALFLGLLCAPGLPKSSKRLRKVQGELEREMLRQFHADGVGAEQANASAAYALEWFAIAGLAADAARRPFSQACKDRARLAVEHLCWSMDQRGRTPSIGDRDSSRVLALTQASEPGYVASVTALAARWLRAPAPYFENPAPALRNLMGEPAPKARASFGSKTFAKGGQTIWRRPTPEGVLLLIFDHGPLGHLSIAAHGHADALALWLHWGGEAIFADPGSHLYHAGGALRDTLRGTRAHNTLALAGQDQSRIIGPFAWSHHARSRLIDAEENEVEAEHDGYRRRFGLTHRRRVGWDGEALIIEDRLLGRPKAPRLPWSLGFTLAPGVQVEADGPHADLRTPLGRRLSMSSEEPGMKWTVARTPYAPSFGSLDSTLRLDLEGRLGPDSLVSRVTVAFGAPAHQAKP